MALVGLQRVYQSLTGKVTRLEGCAHFHPPSQRQHAGRNGALTPLHVFVLLAPLPFQILLKYASDSLSDSLLVFPFQILEERHFLL